MNTIPGWKLVPCEPTGTMLLAGTEGDLMQFEEHARFVYGAMINAAHVPPEPATVGELPELPNPSFGKWNRGGLLTEEAFTTDQMQAYARTAIAADRSRAALAAAPTPPASEPATGMAVTLVSDALGALTIRHWACHGLTAGTHSLYLHPPASPADMPAVDCAVCGLHQPTILVDRMGGYVCLPCINDELQKTAADAVDAERYRFLSSNDANCDNARTYEQGQRIAEMWDLFASPHIATKSELDAIIDAAMAQGGVS